MATSDVVLAMLRGYVSKTRQVQIRLPEFSVFVKQYAESYQQKHSSLRMFVENTQAMLAPVLFELAESGKCSLEYDGSDIKEIIFDQYLADKIRTAYQDIEQDANVPFPNEERLQIAAPPGVTTVDIKSEFVRWLSTRLKEPQILRLSFPEDISNLLVTTDLLQRKLLEYSVLKVRAYLSTGRNSGYILQRLKEVFTLKDQVIQSMLHDIVTRPNQVVDNLVAATEFIFSFWAHLVSTILKEFKGKGEKLPQEHGYCQACYIIGLYNVYFKGLLQRDHDVGAALKSVEKRLLKEPFYFTVSEIYSFRDEKGVPLTTRCPRNKIDEFLEKKTHSENTQLLPEVVRIRTHTKKEYFIHKGIILRLTLNKVFAAARDYKQQYTDEWFENLGNFKKTPVMLHDDAFEEDLAEHLKQGDPLLHALLNFELLYLCSQERSSDDEVNRRIDRILDLKRQTLVPLDELLGIRRKDMLTEARLRLPLWKTMPLFKHLFHMFDRMLGGGKGKQGTRGREEERTKATKPSKSVKVLTDVHDKTFPRNGPTTEKPGEAPSHSTAVAGDSVADQFGPYAVPDLGELGGAPSTHDSADAGAKDAGDRNARGGREASTSEGRGAHAPSPAPAGGRLSAKQRAAAYKEAMERLAEKVVGKNQSIDARLKELAGKWNPLIADKAKRNLVEDVNSFVRDQVRILKRSTLRKPPDLERVENLSRRISETKVFEEIKRKEEFREYVKLYLIKMLGKV